jgi:hypothetical protein
METLMNPDMSGALMGDELTDPAEGLDEPAPADGLAFGEGDETELDPLFAADAQAVFPDFDDDQLTQLQKLIDSRIEQLYGTPEPEMEPLDEGAPLGDPLAEGDLGL